REFDREGAASELNVRAETVPTTCRDAKVNRTTLNSNRRIASSQPQHRVAFQGIQVQRAFNSGKLDRANTLADFQISQSRNAYAVIDLPWQGTQIPGKGLTKALHQRLVVSSRREDSDMVRVFVEDEIIHNRELCQIGFAGRVQFDLSRHIDFVPIPALNSD